MAQKIDTKTKTKTGSNALITLVAITGMLVLVNFFISPQFFGRADLTDQGVHTLSDASKEVVQNLEDVTVRIFISDSLPDSIKQGYRRIKLRGVARAFLDKLEEYQAYSDGNMSLIRVDEDIEKQAEKAKVELFASDEAKVEGAKLEFNRFALGATFHYKNVKEVYPLALRPAEYEQEITWILSRLKDKYEKSLLLKDMLSSGKAVFDGVQTCNDAIQKAVGSDEKPTEDEEGLKGLIASAEQTGRDLTALRAQKERLDKVCTKIQGLMADNQQALRKHKNEYVDILLASVSQYQNAYQQFSSALTEPDDQIAMTALQVAPALDELFKNIDGDHENLINSPGRKRIGIVCGHGEFCPFPNPKKVVQKEMAAIMGQGNALIQQFITQAEQLETRINQTNDGVGQFIKRKMKKDITRLDLSKPIDKSVDALIIMGPDQNLGELALYHLDQFILQGRSVVVFEKTWDVSILNIQPATEFTETDKPNYSALAETPPGLRELLGHYGIQINSDLILEPFQHEPILITQWREFRGRLMPAGQGVAPFPLLPTIQDLNRENALFVSEENITLPYASSLTLKPAGELNVESLAATSPQAVVRDTAELGAVPLLPPDTLRMARAASPTGSVPVVAYAHGKAESYFKGKDKPAAKAKPGQAPPAPKPDEGTRLNEGPVRLLVFASNLGLEGLNAEDVLSGFSLEGIGGSGGMDFLSDFRAFSARFTNWQLRIEQIGEIINRNLSFLQSVLDWAVKDEALVAIRGKMHNRRPLENQSEQTKSAIVYGNVVGIPLLFVLFGFLRYSIRRKRTQTYLVD